MALQPFVWPWSLHQFRNLLYTVCRTPWMSDQPVARPLPCTQNKRKQTSMLLSGIRTHDPSVRASEDSSCLRLRGHRDRRDLHSTEFNFLRVLRELHFVSSSAGTRTLASFAIGPDPATFFSYFFFIWIQLPDSWSACLSSQCITLSDYTRVHCDRDMPSRLAGAIYSKSFFCKFRTGWLILARFSPSY
jgi:hypothetical protein